MAPQIVGRKAPGPKTLPLLGNLHQATKEPLSLLTRAWREHGDIVGFKFGPIPYFLVTDPDAIHHILVDNPENYLKGRNYKGLKLFFGNGIFTSEGSMWRQYRKILQPGFSRARLATMSEAMVDEASKAVKKWRPGETIEILKEMRNLTLLTVSRALFSYDMTDTVDTFRLATATAAAHASKYAESILRVPLGVPTPANRRFREAMEVIDGTAYRIIDRASPKDDDLLTMMLEAKDENGQGLTRLQLRDEVVTELVSGFGTMAALLTWTFYLLSRHPDIARGVRAELDEHLGGRAPAFDDLKNLVYTRMVIDETLRLYPPGWAFERQAVKRDVIAGYEIPAGAIVLISPYFLHRSPRYWENPEGFDPERFAPDVVRRPHYTYLPFGSGPRICIGNNFALLGAHLTLATVLQAFRLEAVPGQEIALAAKNTLNPRDGILMTLFARDEPRPAPAAGPSRSVAERTCPVAHAEPTTARDLG